MTRQEKIIISLKEFKEIGKKGFLVGDGVILSENSFKLFMEQAKELFDYIIADDSPPMYIIEINDEFHIVNFKDTNIKINFKNEGITEALDLCFRRNADVTYYDEFFGRK